MRNEPKVVAILTENEALSSILHMVLSERSDLRVRMFKSDTYLSLYMHIAPVDLLVCDDSFAFDGPDALVPSLRAKPSVVSPDFQVIALARSITPATRAACVQAGIDEVLIKPMSPKLLEERVLARLEEGPRHIRTKGYTGPERRQGRRSTPSERFARRASNVVPLFDRLPDNVVPIR